MEELDGEEAVTWSSEDGAEVTLEVANQSFAGDDITRS